MQTTLADIVISAQATAQKLLKAKDQLAQESLKLEDFAAAGFDRADYATWAHEVDANASALAAFAKQDSPATAAAKKAIPAPSVSSV